MKPPRLARALLRLVVHPDDRDFLLADLEEELARISAARGPRAARRWYRTQAFASVWPSLRRRASRGLAVDRLAQDLRFAACTLQRRPVFTAVAAGTLAVAIGANAAVFSVVNGILFKPVPGIAAGEGVIEVTRDLDGSWFDLSYPVVRRLDEASRTTERVAAMGLDPVAVGGDERPEVRMSLAVTPAYFEVLRLAPSRGRFFTEAEAALPDARRLVVVSDAWAAERFPGGDAVGRTLRVNGVPFEVVGVGPEGFRGHSAVPVDLFLVLGAEAPGLRSPASLANVDDGVVEALARLRPGASREAAAEELSALADEVSTASAGGADRSPYLVRVEPWGRVPGTIRGAVAAFLSVLLGLAGLVLAMACTNVAGMALARASERGGEMAVRLALGAGRRRIVGQLLVEAVALALLGGAAGLALAGVVARLFAAFEPPLPAGFELALDFGLDARVVAYVFAATLGTAVLFNLAPALSAGRTDVVGALKEGVASGEPGRTRGRSALVAGQMALSLVLLVAAGLFLRALSSLRSLDPGWDADGVLVAEVDLALVGAGPEEGLAFWEALRARLAGAPGIEAAAVSSRLPLSGLSSLGDVHVAGVPGPGAGGGHRAHVNRVSPGYSRTLDVALLGGRDFAPSDDGAGERVAVVNETMARRLWPAGDPLGSTFRLGGEGTGPELRVVGVVEDTRYERLVEETPSFYYVPAAQWYDPSMAVLLRPAPGAEDAARTALAGALAELRPDLPPAPAAPLTSRLSLQLLPQRLAAWTTGVLGAMGLLLGAVGVYGVTAFSVGRRTREIGIRLALGAGPVDVVLLVLRQGMRAPLVGVAVGLVGALAVAWSARAFLGEVGPLDPAAFGGALSTLLAVAAAATLVPAWRAARRSPVGSLRTE